MALRSFVFEIIKQFSGQGRVLTIPTAFVDYTGSLDCALFLSQVIFISDTESDANGWFPRSYVQWKAEIRLGEYEVRKACNQLKSLDLIETKLKKKEGAPTVWYRLKVETFSESILEFLQNRNLRNSRIESVENAESFITRKTTRETEGEKEISGDSQKPAHKAQTFGKMKVTSAERDQVLEVFAYWTEARCKRGAKLIVDSPRWTKTVERLREGYTVEDLKLAIDGIALSPHHMGKNDRGEVYDDLFHVCKSPEQVEKFKAKALDARSLATTSRRSQQGAMLIDPNQLSEKTRGNAYAIQEWLDGNRRKAEQQ